MNNQIVLSSFKEPEACEEEFALLVRPLAGFESIMGIASLEFPITAIPAQLNFCVKTNIVFGDVFNDTCRVLISFWNGDLQLYEEVWTNVTSLSEWTEISLPLTQIEPVMDKCRIEIQSSYPGIGLGSGSTDTWISVDDFRFDSTNGTEEEARARNEVNIYPNPSNDGLFNITSTNILGRIIIRDLLGNVVMDKKCDSNTYSIENHFSQGIYFISANGNQQKIIVR